MKRAFSNKRVARKIGGKEEEEESDAATSEHNTDTVVKRPSLSSKVKKKSNLRLSFGPGTSDAKEDGEARTLETPRKPVLSRQAIERNAERKLRPATPSHDLFPRAGNGDRPSYSKDSLTELRNSTPSTPIHLSSLQTSEDDEIEQTLDVASKFGSAQPPRHANSAIPTEAEIREKKERRARLAKEQEYISLEPNDSGDEQRELLLRPKEKYAESRLVKDDEDVAEGFEDFVEDGQISLGKQARREEKRRKRREMEELIVQAEAEDSEAETDDSEVERHDAYEAAQTRAGTYGQHRNEDDLRSRPPPKITPIPELGAVLARLRANTQNMEIAKAVKSQRLAEIQAEKKDIAEQEVWIQSQLKEVGERYEKLRGEIALAGGTVNETGSLVSGEQLPLQRGLESFGSTPVAALSEASDEP